ncbi:acid phosphatase (class A) [Novosphingobium sp. PhB165]|uniref:acid phosphatase n=1 Tax=Novosphingobium sp. PhB165 TaxID=2485105 RepID=UPI001046F91D|nr:phosphatase PAP2 family protein [Novosphingobium sp. PhB165]TCM20450.1 acid phosphatase (class A) [Novosphingobium sp. PhB165]
MGGVRSAALLSSLAAAATFVSAAAQAPDGQTSARTSAGSVPSITAKLPPGMPKGYLPMDQLPDSLALLPPPPAAESAAFARDEEVSKAMSRAPGSPRFVQAASDADLKPAHAFQTFACAAGVTPDPKRTPVLYRLLGKSMIDIGLSTYKAKDHYQRVRPFVAHGNGTCLPADEATLRTDGSYPSGHSALGWGWALIFTQLVPEHTDAILQRGYAFGESRLVCNAHWASDVDAGRLMAAAAVARLNADKAFRADLDAARAELASRPSAPPAATCAAEAAGLTMQ